MHYKDSDYAINKYSNGIVYRSVTGEKLTVTYEDMKMENPSLTLEEYQEIKRFSDEDYHISCNTDNNYSRKKLPFDILEEIQGYSVKSPEDVLLLRELTDKLHRAIESLTETQKRRVRLYYFEGLTGEQIAAAEGVSQKRVSKSIILAKEKIKDFFN